MRLDILSGPGVLDDLFAFPVVTGDVTGDVLIEGQETEK